ncbi:hypothetical protein GS941_16745 [Rhodococcus hoagii]|nr:hypothetical protein [Prescottella equi]
MTGTGVPVTFFGEATRMPAGRAAGARHRCAPATGQLLVHTRRLGVPCRAADRHERWTAADDLRRWQPFAAGIAAHPADWHMLQRVWTADIRVDR